MWQVSFELKYPEHAQWPLQLSRLYALLAATGLSHKFALVAEGAGQAKQHLEAQRRAGVQVTLLQLHRDMDAPRGADGVPHFNHRRVRTRHVHPHGAWHADCARHVQSMHTARGTQHAAHDIRHTAHGTRHAHGAAARDP